MHSFVLLLLILLLVWYLSVIWLGRRRLFGFVAAPVLATTLHQYLGFKALGYVDTFTVIAVFFSIAICAVAIAALEQIRQQVATPFFKKLRRKKGAATFYGVCIAGLISIPSTIEVYDRYQFRAETDAFMLQRAKEAASEIMKEREILPTQYEIEAIRRDSARLYEVTFYVDGKSVAVVKLSRPHLKLISIRPVTETSR